jgi:hypothetical protein
VGFRGAFGSIDGLDFGRNAVMRSRLGSGDGEGREAEERGSRLFDSDQTEVRTEVTVSD